MRYVICEGINYGRTEDHYKVLCTYELEEKVPRDFHKYFLDNWHTCRVFVDTCGCIAGEVLHRMGNQTRNRLESFHGKVKAYLNMTL